MNGFFLQQGEVALGVGLRGYQFPKLGDQEDGYSDWLDVHLRLQHGEHVWERTDAALTTAEVQDLIDWLEEVAERSSVFGGWRHQRLTTRIFFTEPCLGFEVLNGHSSTFPMIFRCYLAAEFLPPFADRCNHAALGDHPEEVWLDFGVDETQVRMVAQGWRDELRRFPLRVDLRSPPS